MWAPGAGTRKGDSISVPTLASLNLGPIEFLSPVWLLLIPLLGGLSVWIGAAEPLGAGSTATKVAVGDSRWW